ncbi:hypothetical protein [Serratia fonticola]|uniref:hypothetical protein n=1 Tax=Serratia fonticola TaxID=47917 RepID=UPI0008FD624E|nr:hypothetical protein [Serratia fonticola]MDQ7209769.1 hypothetical protein [Serratia fonticola]OIX93410.1 hypothetical protein BFS14_18660 [Serratia fonticola]QCR62813.1 hypothetical protein FD644_21770 [Serratia fonticola]HBE9080726.1 hypothetical protein [Serratia fonticola]
MLGVRGKLTLIVTLFSIYSGFTSAKSECREMATRVVLDSDTAPTFLKNKEDLEDLQAFMYNSEVYCKRLIKAIKTGKVTADSIRIKTDYGLKEAEEKYQNDGDVDAFELEKMLAKVTMESVRIAEK